MTTTTPPRTTSDREPRAARRRLLRRLLGIGVVVALAVGGIIGVRHREAGLAAGLADALASLGTAGEELDAAIADGEAALAESDGKVESDQRRTALVDALNAAGVDRRVAPGSRAERTERATRLAAETRDHADRVTAAAAAVRADVAAWFLARAVDTRAAALAGLDAAVASGEELLAGTEGRVLPDNGPRQTLRDALDAAITARDADVDLEDADAVTASAGRIDDSGAALGVAVAGVTSAHEAWRAAEADRVAAEQAAAAAAGQRRTAGRPGSTSSSGSEGASSPAAATGSGGSSSTGGAGGGTWVEVPGTPMDLCATGDQYGNFWEVPC